MSSPCLSLASSSEKDASPDGVRFRYGKVDDRPDRKGCDDSRAPRTAGNLRDVHGVPVVAQHPEADLVDQLFNSSERHLARLLANFGKEGKMETVIPTINQDVLAAKVGTTRSRINFFMNMFRKLGFIEYNGGLKIHTSLLNVIVHD
ncbi:MAG TPA: helix-turn-helix domain-containing protein [Terrimicrobiaceae bacterium]|nr:helix-turn-helix domain-containing protein [Terrimicrobiaceae bacterium]